MAEKRELLDRVLSSRDTVSELEMKLSTAKKEKDSAEAELRELMELTEEMSFKTEDGILVSRKETLRVSTQPGMQQDVLKWVDEDKGRPDLIKRTIHHKTLQTFISGLVKEGETVPVELIRTFFQPSIAIRRNT